MRSSRFNEDGINVSTANETERGRMYAQALLAEINADDYRTWVTQAACGNDLQAAVNQLLRQSAPQEGSGERAVDESTRERGRRLGARHRGQRPKDHLDGAQS